MIRNEFNELVHRLSRQLFGYAFRILRNQEEAEDAVQEVFIKLWKLREKLEEYKSIDALATTLVKNYCIDQIRKEKNIFSNDESSQFYIPSANPSPEQQMVNRESDEIIRGIISDLPEVYRTVIQLKDIDGFSYEEIVQQTGQNINTLRVNLSRARKLIRDEYYKFQYEHRGAEQADRKVL